MPLEILKHASFDFTKVLFFVQNIDFEFSEPFACLKHHLSNIVLVAFFFAQYVENIFALPFDTLKHPFIDFINVAF
jgi:hypothetical protein